VRTIAMLISLLLAITTAFFGAEESESILEKIDAYRIPYQDFLIRTKITSFEHDEERETALFDVYVSGLNKSLAIARKYRTRGMKILYVDENMWVQLPNTHRPIRITPIQRLLGEASNGDIAMVSFASDYGAEDAGYQEMDGTDCRKLLLSAKKKSATYNKIMLYVRAADFRLVKAEFYLLSGKHFKTAYYTDFKPFDGKVLLSKMLIVDEQQKWKRTTIETISVEPVTLPARYFNKNNLVHVKGL
jgi:hypothetical protein